MSKIQSFCTASSGNGVYPWDAFSNAKHTVHVLIIWAFFFFLFFFYHIHTIYIHTSSFQLMPLFWINYWNLCGRHMDNIINYPLHEMKDNKWHHIRFTLSVIGSPPVTSINNTTSQSKCALPQIIKYMHYNIV